MFSDPAHLLLALSRPSSRQVPYSTQMLGSGCRAHWPDVTSLFRPVLPAVAALSSCRMLSRRPGES